MMRHSDSPQSQPERRGRSGFTLTELLVVIAIIAILAGLLTPSLLAARRSAQMAACMNNLHQFGLAIESYRVTEDALPMWLSRLYTDMGKQGESFVCPYDESEGKEGARPDWIEASQQYPEVNDIPWDGADGAGFTDKDKQAMGGSDDRRTLGSRDEDVLYCSYMYEWTGEPASWYSGQYNDEGGPAGGATWRQVKDWEVSNASRYPDMEPGEVPVIRCFHHIPIRGDGEILDRHDPETGATAPDENYSVLNYRYGGNVDKSWPTRWEAD